VADLSTVFTGIHFENPVWTASGTFGYGKEFAHLIDLNLLGGIVVKGISAEPMEGNPAPRIYETDSGMLNAIGLQNVGARRFLEEKLPFLRTLRTRCIVNVFGFSTDDYVRCLKILNEGDGIDAYELNISCPNTRAGGMVYGSDPKLTEEVVAAAKKVARYPLFVKLSPNVTDIAAFARVAEAAGADALSLVNTFVGMAIDIEKFMPIENFRSLFRSYTEKIKGSKKASGVSRIYLPGEIEAEKERSNLRDGIEINPETAKDLNDLLEKVKSPLRLS